MGWVIGPAFLATMILSRDVPSPAVGGLALMAIVLTSVGGRLARWERAKPRPAMLMMMAIAVCVVLPHALAGFGLSIWMIEAGLDIRLGFGVLLILSVVSVTFLLGRRRQLFASSIALLAPGAVVDGSLLALDVTVLIAIVLFVVARMRVDLDHDDINELQEQERSRNRYENILRDYEDTGRGWFWETDRRGQLSYISSTVAQAIGRSHEELLGRPLLELFDPAARLTDAEQDNTGEHTLAFHLSARASFQELPIRAAAIDHERWWSVSGRPVYDEFDNFVGFCGSGTDLTEKQRSEQNASRMAHYDPLTGLANRFQMAQSLAKILDAPQEMQRDCAVFLLDLDRFKEVNDTLGHPTGDVLLKQVARRLEDSVGERGLVGRLGGDEFKVVIPGRVVTNDLHDLATGIIRSLSRPYTIDKQSIAIGASIGIATSPADGVTSKALIRNADLALYAAKNGGRGRHHFYSSDLHSAAEERAALENDLRDAISRGGLELHFQPVVNLDRENIAGFEALLRWNHPTKGWLAPSKFIPLADDTGLSSALGEWAIRSACQELTRWPEDLRCAVNVSALQFFNVQLPSVVTQALARAGVAPDRLELEVTESVFQNDRKDLDAMFAALKAIGVRLVLDDFGTGYSSLGYLRTAPFDTIKIDQSFVRGASEPGSRNGPIMKSITGLAKALGMETTAEGVETIDELELVRRHGFSYVQGYVYEKPLSAAEALARLEKGLSAPAKGPRSVREPRHKLLRKVVLEHEGQSYNGTIRDISTQGVLIEGLWGVPVGTSFEIALSQSVTVQATSRWNDGDRTGLELSAPIARDANGAFIAKKVLGSEPPYGVMTRRI